MIERACCIGAATSGMHTVGCTAQATAQALPASTISQGSIDESGERWSISYPGDGTDHTWVLDDEQPYENWRYYHTADGWWTLILKHDGCAELAHAANTPFWIDGRQLTDAERDWYGSHDCDDFIHICNARSYLDLIRTVIPLADAWENRPR
jgi:hypothetical protein